MTDIQSNLAAVRERIRRVCERIGRDPGEVTLVAVTKTHEPPVINEAIALGVTDIGENRVQEMTRKFPEVTSGVRWHLIGHLQTNKVKYIIRDVALIHSVDSLRLAQEIDRRAAAIGKVQDVLIQVNIAEEPQKSGIAPEELDGLIREMSDLSHIRITGLMNIALYTDDPAVLRRDFRRMKELYDGLSRFDAPNLQPETLSMGMSSDFEIALEEGANMIRVGTNIFGRRS